MKFTPPGVFGLSLVFALAAGSVAAEQPRHFDPAACIQIKTAMQLQAMNSKLDESYCLKNDIDLGAIASFVPIGNSTTPFIGHFDGNNHTISNLKIQSAQAADLGLFGGAVGAMIQNLVLVNVDIAQNVPDQPGLTFVTSGGLIGFANGNPGAPVKVSHVTVSGSVKCAGGHNVDCAAGGVVGDAESTKITNTSSSADVVSSFTGGGVVGTAGATTIFRSYATGSVRCAGGACTLGGVAGLFDGTMMTTFATATVNGKDSRVAGLVAHCGNCVVKQSYATGRVVGKSPDSLLVDTAGLIDVFENGTLQEAFAAGQVKDPGDGGRGLIGDVSFSISATFSYWDASTTGQQLSAAGTKMNTAALQAQLPAGFGSAWGINATLSYPYLADPRLDFTSILATLVLSNRVYTFVPISQLDKSNYTGATNHLDQASLATVYTMIARGIGTTRDIGSIDHVKVNKYFWDDATQTTSFAGPVTNHATLGALKNIPAGTPIGNQVLNKMNARNLVILRGSYRPKGGGKATHYLLGTLYTKGPTEIVADDPWTGKQVYIDPATKTVISPKNFPLDRFKVDGYQPVTIN